ncbi:MAG: tyrosine-type recombinase/integrase [Citrobacter freundii]|uniref:tyrosine-type recombinase/integrase n=1 Tax=Enterobacteriaceae TaxID=543 RepID=UPI00032E73E8|nr:MULTISPECIES: tyrosine-type recombinase/integrase [Enterobacteriaceae]EIN8658236.1 tyrosine-type recombinase/integrase [Citrobacter freundii]EJN1469841.1 tyrosine-type recombinase/integrase [Citrobacter freundii]ELI7003478.1 tyrosine-type recombinase/integrase [Citrobacter freundii]EOD60801.1 site-specific recombinase phage integrase family protein [Citrobacter freundii GTC 09629]EUB34954.1 site-specific recombinase, phage integrase family [Klebsiella sp. AS10]
MARTNAPTPEEARQIEAVLRHRNETFADAWALNLNLALRISDLLALTFDDVAGNVVTIKEKKTSKLKVFPINNRARGIINRRRAAYPEDVFLFQSKSNRVKNQPARAITREAASRAFSEAGEMVTDKNISSHSARKCRGRALWEAGTPIETISKMLNHSSPAVTMTYLDITQDEVNQTYDLNI